jgi:hypothetical protein
MMKINRAEKPEVFEEKPSSLCGLCALAQFNHLDLKSGRER